MSFRIEFEATVAEAAYAEAKARRDMGETYWSKLNAEQKEFLIAHEAMHMRVARMLIHSMLTSNISDPNDEV
jgi:hypothetical protein